MAASLNASRRITSGSTWRAASVHSGAGGAPSKARKPVISFTKGVQKYNLRAAAVLVHDGAVLLHRLEGDPYWALPGGRVELGESGAETVVREMQEELGLSLIHI